MMTNDYRSSILKGLFVLMFYVFVLPPSNGETMNVKEKFELKVLIIGNSYSRDAFSYVPALLENIIPNIVLEFDILYIGGVSLDRHYDYLINNKASFILDTYRSETSKWVSTTNYAVTPDLFEKNWNLIILQEGYPNYLSQEEAYLNIRNIRSYIDQYVSGVKYAYMINPTHPIGTDRLGTYGNNEEFYLIAETAKLLKENRDVDFIIPCGTAIQNARHTRLNSLGDYGQLTYEGRHLQEGIPCMIEALTATQTLINIFGYNIDIEDCNIQITQSWVKEKAIPGQHGKVIQGSVEDYVLCKDCASAAIVQPYNINYIYARSVYPLLFPDEFGLEAHRGFSKQYPENTELSFLKAAEVDVFWGIETDVRMTKDGFLVCIHDDTIDRTTNGSGKVSDYTYSELQQFYIDDGYGWDSSFSGKLKIPKFERYLEICKEYGKIPYVELKKLSDAGIQMTIDMLRSKGFQDGTYVLTSFTKKNLLYASTICDAPLEYMKSELFSDKEIQELSNYRKFVIRVPASKITEDFVEKCHKFGLLVEVYGIPVGGEHKVTMLKEWGVEGGTCNSWENLGQNNNIRNMEPVVSTCKTGLYSLFGYRIDASYKGIIIKDGRKIVNR